MKVAILSAGPSLHLYDEKQGEYDCVLAINRAAQKYPCDWWCFKDAKLFSLFGAGRRYGLLPEPLPTGVCMLGPIEDGHTAFVTYKEDRYTEYDKDIVAWARSVRHRNMGDWEFNGFKGYGQKSHGMWKKMTVGMTLMLAYQLGASSIDAFGCDMEGTEDFDGLDVGNRTPERWEMEREIFFHIEGWLKERGIPLTRHLPVPKEAVA